MIYISYVYGMNETKMKELAPTYTSLHMVDNTMVNSFIKIKVTYSKNLTEILNNLQLHIQH